MKPGTSTAMRSHLNYFKLLFERDMQLLQPGGYLNILIPSSFQTDEGSYGLRKLAFIENKLIELFSFENRGFMEDGKVNRSKIFPDVDSRFKFSIVFVQKHPPQTDDTFKSLFYLNDPKDLHEKTPLPYSLEMVKRFSPDNLSIMEFANEPDYILCGKIMGDHPTLRQLNYNFRREFNVTDDSEYFFKEKKGNNTAPVYEGKVIHQYNAGYSKFNYYINPAIAHEMLIDKETKRIKTDLQLSISTKKVREYFDEKNYQLDYQTYRMVYRAIGRSTDERTLIATIIPPGTFSVNSVNYLIKHNYKTSDSSIFQQDIVSSSDTVYMMALMNSLVLNYFIRNKISANLNMFYLYELPVPQPSESIKAAIVSKAFALLYHKSNKVFYEDLRTQLNVDKTVLNSYQHSDTHNMLRATIEILIAKELYGLTLTDWQYLTATFVYGENAITRTELKEIIRLSEEMWEKA